MVRRKRRLRRGDAMTQQVTKPSGPAHPYRKEIARYLLERGIDPVTAEPDPERVTVDLGSGHKIEYPDGLRPIPAPITPAPSVDDPLPPADVVVVTWTVDELAGLAHVFTPKVSGDRWHRYARSFDTYKDKTRPHSPASNSRRLASYMLTTVGPLRVLCMKSELHLNQDG